ncbi:MAG: sugar transferase [Lachnospiraceae bacterium]|nr:sugar transferase [Lachnospiraceae bacterium]
MRSIRSTDAWKRLYMLTVCAVMVAVDSAMILYILNQIYNVEFRTQIYLRGHIFVMALYIGVFIFLGRVFGGLLVGVRRIGEIVFSFIFTALFSDLFFYTIVMLLSYKIPDPRPLLLVLLLQLVFSCIWIVLTGKLYHRHFKPLNVLLVYYGESYQGFLEKLRTRKDQFFISDTVSTELGQEPVKEKIDRYNTIMLWDIPSRIRNPLVKYCYENSKRIYVMPKITDIILNGSSPVHLFDTPLLLTEGNPLEYEERILKRIMDIILSLILIVVTSPIMLLTALAVKLCDGGPVFYKQVRCTRNFKEFKIIKFRSMIVNAESKGGAMLARQHDPRITPVGRFIRKCRIDELPQLFNVIKGDMSFVGPRPERPEFVRQFMETMPEFVFRMKVRAGITGYAQLYGKYNTRPYDKLKFDLYYIEQYSIWLDIKLMILTFKIIFSLESTEGTKEKVSAGNEALAEDESEKLGAGEGKPDRSFSGEKLAKKVISAEGGSLPDKKSGGN